MRLLFILLALPYLLLAQDTTRAADRRIGLRAGLALHFDGNTTENYTERLNDYIPYYSRRMLVNGVVSWQPFRGNRGLRLQGRVAYDDFTFKGNNTLLGHTRFGNNFRETVRYRHLQNALGVYTEVSPERPYTLYVSGHFLLSIPLSIRYEATRSLDVDLPSFSVINGGAQWSGGYEFGTGVRIKASEKWLASLGVYYTRQNIGVEWPVLTARPFRENVILNTNSFGLLLTWQFQGKTK